MSWLTQRDHATWGRPRWHELSPRQTDARLSRPRVEGLLGAHSSDYNFPSSQGWHEGVDAQRKWRLQLPIPD